MLEGISISFNVDVAALQKLGIDPTTSEGKAALKEVIIESFQFARKSSVRGRANPVIRGWSGQECGVMDAFLQGED